MLIAMGHTVYGERIRRDFPNILVYPEFFDSKRELIQGDFKNYVKKLWNLRTIIKIAIYPDYIYYTLTVPKNVEYIIPVHSLNEGVVRIYKQLSNFTKVWLGFASNEKYRDYEITDFIEFAKRLNAKRWYLGVSTKRELREAIRWNFDGLDITTMLLGKFEQIKNLDYVVRKLRELLNYTKSQGSQRQTTLYEFVNWGVY
ncbi:hypothetical protein GFS03_08190 [Sulfolobus sp. E5-1-F]|uniref:hypothetical protein n=1 Tax=Saccharolobus sp. E5-1-F TaxID=2663019 RepID=UPI001297848A|nr:hypothetical protein [Sulfolobus sp. E5-1-F]QGA54550.1 hypothetical protein GFS03_08190 [Sulfolobus sp. E5-1-F]